MTIDMYGERVASASELIREFAKVDYFDYFKGDPERAMEAFIAMLAQAEEKGRQEGADLLNAQRRTNSANLDGFAVERAALLARIGELQATLQNWQPMETAPKDGSRVLAVCEGKVCFFHWQDIKGFDAPIGWRNDFITVYRDGEGPTHWMPIPPAPSGTEGEGNHG